MTHHVLTKENSLLTVGRTVDEAAFLYFSLDNACHTQLLAEAAAANGVPKRIISNEVAKYTADVAQNHVSYSSVESVVDGRMADDIQHNFYTEFQPEYELIVEETNGRVLQ